jgi:hypothetical protein
LTPAALLFSNHQPPLSLPREKPSILLISHLGTPQKKTSKPAPSANLKFFEKHKRLPLFIKLE